MPLVRPDHAFAGFRLDNTGQRNAAIWEAGELWVPSDNRIPEHANPGWELHLQVRGTTRWKVGELSFELREGDFYLIAPRIAHLLERSVGDQHFFFVVFDATKVLSREEQGWMKLWPQRVTHGSGGHSLLTPFQSLIREIALPQPHASSAIRLHLSVLSLELTRLLESESPPKPVLATHPAAQKVRQLIENRPDQSWRLERLAQQAGISVSYLIRVFRREYGLTPKQFLLNWRLEQARRQLEVSNLPVTQIALTHGFSSSQHFANAFRRRFGRTPKSGRRYFASGDT